MSRIGQKYLSSCIMIYRGVGSGWSGFLMDQRCRKSHNCQIFYLLSTHYLIASYAYDLTYWFDFMRYIIDMKSVKEIECLENISWNRRSMKQKKSKGQLISECLFDILNFAKDHRKIWQISSLEYKKWSNQQNKGILL